MNGKEFGKERAEKAKARHADKKTRMEQKMKRRKDKLSKARIKIDKKRSELEEAKDAKKISNKEYQDGLSGISKAEEKLKVAKEHIEKSKKFIKE